jgi:amino acid adenylation domain-containing protein/non-ribosomal peptide synthase protein (TIGR01720 family)
MSLNDRLAALTPEQRALFEKLKEKQRQVSNTVRSMQPPPIRRVSGPTGEGDWPLSLDQERYWFMEQLYPEGAGLNITAATRMRGTVSPVTVAAALTEIVRRHAAWRTVFPAVDGKPVQRVTAARPQRLAVIDLGGLPAARREPEALRLVNEDSATVFDLEAGPLVRSSLVRLSDLGEARDHVCILTVHHMVTDWISFQVAWGELAALYATFAEGGRPALPEPPVHYSDFAVWQREWLQGEVLEGLTTWWRERLAGFPVILDLPTDRPRPSAPRMRGGSLPVAVPAELTGGLRRLAQREGSTLFMVVLAATAALLHRDSGQERLVLGANNANRNRPEIEAVLGCFLTQVPFAIDLTPQPTDPTFRELLARVRQSALGAYSHQDLPFGLLVQALELERDPSRQPLIQTLVQVLGGQESSEAVLGDATFEAVSSYDGRARYDLLLSLFDNPSGLAGTLEYDLDLFDAATTTRRIERLLLQLAAVVADPDVRLSALPVLPEAARHQVEIEWNDTARLSGSGGPGGSDWTAPRRFAEQAARTPEALAVDAAAGTLSYRQLDERSTSLAHRLRALGVGTESRVALLLDRTLDVPVAIFGVWKAGAAYVPLDPDTPAARLADLLADAESAAVIHRGASPAALDGLRSLDLSDDGNEANEGLAAPASDTALPEVRRGDLAYLIYTSGTTGKPKAVMVEHGSLAVTITSFIERFSLGPGDRVPHLSRYTFDASFLDIVAPLLCGACMELLTRDELLDPDRLLQALARSATLFTVPSLIRRVLSSVPGAREHGAERLAGLRAMTLGGDVVPPDLQAEVLAAFPSTQVDVVYGPTEATIICVLHRVERGRRPERALIGRPMPEVEVRVVDPRGQAVPLGIPGELWIGGPTVARGYFRREELTAERFVVVDEERGGRRFYRTGDLVRQVPSEGGALEFLGRIDLQVKVRGFRIEPGEVEAALLANPAVRDAVAVALPGPGGENQLVAYVVGEGEAAPSAEELHGFLRKLLPEHMVPSLFVPLAALPLSANGKVDRKALPDPAAAREALAGSAGWAGWAGWATPRNAREELLAEIWRGVLGLDQVGIHDNFFQLGGDSILSIQVVARARRAGLLVSPRQLFENQTIAGLAAASEGIGSADAGSAEEAQGSVEGEVPLTPIQRRFFAEERQEPWRFNQAVLLAPRERLDAAPLAAALARLAGHHDALRLRFLREEGGWRQLHAPIGSAAASAPLFEIDLAALPPGSGALETAAEQLQSGLDLARGPIFTAALFRRAQEGDEGDEGDRLLLTAHHLVVDGVSWRVLLEDLTALLRGLDLAPKTTSWKRWAERLAGYAGGAELAAERGYWLGVGGKDQRDSKDSKDQKEQITARATVSVELGAEATRALLLEAPPVYRTQVNDLLLAALARTLAAWRGEGTLLIDLEGHGREEIFSGVDLSRTVGWFTTIFPVALELPPGAGPREAIRSVKETLRAVPGRGLGYGLLRYLGDPETAERLAALPAPQVSFNYLGRFDAAVGEGGLFAFAAEAVRGGQGEPIPGDHLFAVDALVLEDRLRVNWTYDRLRHLPETAERLAHGFLAELEALTAHCLSPEAGGFTPSDFPLARLDQETLDRLVGNDPGVEDLYPLAPMQEGLLFHSLYTPGGGLYVEQFTAALEGPLDAPAFAAAWQRVIERHPALRTGFLWQGIESPLQLVRRQAELPWTVEDWRGLPPAEAEARWQDLLAADRARGFDLAQAPLMRLVLVRTDQDKHLLAWSSHHLIFDGWCFSLILGEVFALYAAAVSGASGGESPLPSPPRPYRDYIAWIAGRDPAEAEHYWRQALSGFTVPTPLPFDHPEALSGAHAGRADDYFQRVLTLPAPRAAALGALAQRLQVTLNTLVQAVWALFLARSAQVSDIVFGAVVSGRPAELPGVESMIGLFINTVPVRVEVPREGTAAAWLARLQASQFELRQHEWTPLTRIQALSEVPHREPLFASLLVFENYPVAPSVSERLRELRISEVEHGELTNYPLTLIVAVHGELALRLTADRRFEPATAQRLLTQLDNLLGALAADPERPPLSLPLLSAAEEHQLTVEWNDTAAAYPTASSIPALFAEQAALRPTAVAVEMGNERLTYGELRQRAGRFARRLLALGARPGERVAVLAERSPDLIAALLGILEAGGAYLPLDPVQPADRLAWMARDAGASLLINAGGTAGPARELPEGLRLVGLEDGDEDDGSPEAAGKLRPLPPLPPLPPIPAEAIAYVLYTSGSTGTPKGVAVSHRSVLRLVRGADFAAIGPDEAWLQYSPIAFDLSTLEIWAPLLNGGRLVLFPGRIGSLEELAGVIAGHGVTSAWLTAGLFHEMVDGCLEGLRPLRQLLVGGDVVSAEHARRTLEAFPGLTLIDGYGPTENTTFTSCYRMTSGITSDQLGANVPIGRPIANSRAYVLDDALQPVPTGVWGELYAGGDGVATGYLDRPDLTAERFVPDPFAVELGGRLYRTGDSVRWRDDGVLEFQGRLDAQIKIRGFRIEPAEVEAVLVACPGVQRAAVVGIGPAGNKRLAAFWVGDAKVEELRAFLRGRLPEAMVPSAFVPLPELPLTANGKVDRRALSEASGMEVAAARPAERVPPRTPMEEDLVAAWAEVLKRDPGEISVLDNFFDLGGHSLLVTRFISLFRSRFGTEVPMQLVFDTENLAGLADRIVESELVDADEDMLAALLAEMGETPV